MLNDENGYSRLFTPPSGGVNPPVNTRVQVLPFEELTWEDFEKLCYRLICKEAKVEYCQQYGIKGDIQDGIDIYARKTDSNKYAVYQCKNEKNFGPAKIAVAVKKFINGNWLDKSDFFIICTRENLQSKLRSDALEKQAKLLASKAVILIPWDCNHLSSKLKQIPELVDDFFGREWVRRFCGEEVAGSLSRRLDSVEFAKLHSELYKFYTEVFNIHDRGIPFPDKLPLIERYIIQDVVDLQKITPEHSSNLIQQSINSATLAKEQGYLDRKPEEYLSYSSQQSRRTRYYEQRIPLQKWITRSKKNLIFGEPGSGKSTMMRYIALDLLSKSPTLETVAEKWGNYLPLWIPFALWTRIISDNSMGDPGLKEIMVSWLKAWNKVDLIPLIEDALFDKRLILLIDGLDEYSNSDSAHIAFNHLELFLKENDDIVVFMTTRPHGFKQLGKELLGWQKSQIADLSSKQQRQLTKIWFEVNTKRVNPSLQDCELTPVVTRQCETFFDELASSIELLHLATNPLLLSLLIYLQISDIRLPQSRFKVHKSILVHLLSTHPQARRVAAEATQRTDIPTEDIIIALAHLAYILHKDHQEGIIKESLALNILTDFLKDDQQGLGMETAIARQTAISIIKLAEDNISIINRKSPGEIGFYHRSLQEYLTAFCISRFSADEQTNIVQNYSKDPQWREVILGLFQITSSPVSVANWIKEIRDTNLSRKNKKIIEGLLSEVAFGDFNCPPNLARELAKSTFRAIEFGTWTPHRENLLKYALNGLRSSRVVGLVEERIKRWFPDRLGWNRSYVFNAMSRWTLSNDFLDVLLIGLNDEDQNCRVAAATTLAKVAKCDADIGSMLVDIAKQSDNPYYASSATEALIQGWPSNNELKTIVDKLVHSPMPEQQLVGVKGRVKLGLHTEKDLERVLHLAHDNSPLYLHDNEIAKLLIEGWSKSNNIKRICFESLKGYQNDRSHIRSGIANSVLLSGYSMDDDVVDYIVHQLENDKYPLGVGHGESFRVLSYNFKGNKKLIHALDRWVPKQKYSVIEVSHAALVGCTETMKTDLIKRLKSHFPFWAATSLLYGWGIEDPDVERAIFDCINDSTSKASELAHLYPQIFKNKVECRNKLIDILKNPDCWRYDWVIEGLIRMGDIEDDTEVVDVALSVLKTNNTMHNDGLRSRVISHYNFDPRIRELAIRTLKEKDGAFEAVAYAFGEDEDIRKMVLNLATPLPASLRLTIADYLTNAETNSDFALSILGLYDLEKDAAVKVQASIGYYSKLKNTVQNNDDTLNILSKAIVCYGPDHMERRLAAFCGLTILDRLDIMINAIESIGDEGRIVAINSTPSHNINVPHIQFILKNWDTLESYFAEYFWRRLFDHSAGHGYMWSGLAPFADEYNTPKNRIIEYMENKNIKVAESELLRFLSRVAPRSELLWEYCLTTLGLSKHSSKINTRNSHYNASYRDKIVAAEIIGDQFGQDVNYFRQIEIDNIDRNFEELVLILSEGWPDSKELSELFDDLAKSRRRCSNSTLMRYLCARANPIAMYQEIIRFLKAWAYDSGFRVFEALAPPLIRRIRKDDALLILLIKHLKGYPKPSEKISLSKLIFKSRGLIPELGQWIDQELEAQYSFDGVDVGLDITTGNFVSVPHALFEISGFNQ